MSKKIDLYVFTIGHDFEEELLKFICMSPHCPKPLSSVNFTEFLAWNNPTFDYDIEINKEIFSNENLS